MGYIKICYAYKYKGKIIDYIPDDTEITNELPQPLYIQLKNGWVIPADCNKFEDLPKEAKTFINFIESKTGLPVKYIGYGADIKDTIIR